MPQATTGSAASTRPCSTARTRSSCRPACRSREPPAAQAAARGLDLVGEIELFAREADGRVIGITGTNGKSTVTTLVGEFCGAAGIEVRSAATSASPRSTCSKARRPPCTCSSSRLSSSRPRFAAARGGGGPERDARSPRPLRDARRVRGRQGAHLRACATAVVNLDDEIVVRMPRPRPASRRLQPAAQRRAVPPARARRPGLACRGRRPLLPLAELRAAGPAQRGERAGGARARQRRRLAARGDDRRARRFRGLPHRARARRDWRGIALDRRLQGHQRRRDRRGDRGPRRAADPDRRRRGQGPGLHAAWRRCRGKVQARGADRRATRR